MVATVAEFAEYAQELGVEPTELLSLFLRCCEQV